MLNQKLLHVGARQVQHELIAGFRAWPRGKMQHPVGVLSIELAVGIDHLWFNPQAKVHAQRVDLLYQRREAIGEFVAIRPPIPQACGIISSARKPAVIEHKEPAVYLFKDLHAFLRPQVQCNVPTIRKLREVARALADSYKTLVICSPLLEMAPPPALALPSVSVRLLIAAVTPATVKICWVPPPLIATRLAPGRAAVPGSP